LNTNLGKASKQYDKACEEASRSSDSNNKRSFMPGTAGAKASTGNQAKNYGSESTASPPQSDSQGSAHGTMVAENRVARQGKPKNGNPRALEY
jgi:hypothetical protein